MKNVEDLELSDLEKEIELEMDDSAEVDEEMEEDQEFADNNLESEFEDTSQTESVSAEYEDIESEIDEESPDDYAQRFYELSTREYEDESDLDREISGILGEMERNYFWGGLKKALRRGVSWGKRRVIEQARKYGKGLPGFSTITQLARGNLKGALAALAKQGLGAALRAHPGGAAALTALQGLGFNPLGEQEENRQAWNNFASVAREAYGHLAENVDDESANPLKASHQAAAAFRTAFKNVQSRVGARAPAAGKGYPARGKKYRIRVRPGETVRLRIVGIN